MPRCGTCANAFPIERRPDGKCGHCGGFFEVVYYVALDGGPLGPAYAVVGDDEGTEEPAQLWPRTAQGAISATSQAAWLSVGRGPHEVRLPDGRLMARFVNGRRADL